MEQTQQEKKEIVHTLSERMMKDLRQGRSTTIMVNYVIIKLCPPNKKRKFLKKIKNLKAQLKELQEKLNA